MNDESTIGPELRFSTWSASAPPADFANRVATLALEEHVRTKRGARGVVIPILLAALFMSFGAAAAWEASSWNRPTMLPGEKIESTLSGESREMKWLNIQPSPSTVESIPAPAPLKNPVPRQRGPRITPLKLPPPQALSRPSPTKLHLPRCECGVSASICSCIE